MTTRLVRTRAELRGALANRPDDIGVVMTMGALHAGHRELVRVARRRCATVVVTVFLNPLQFAAGEDLSRYPRTLEADLALCAEEEADLVFAPPAAEVYPLGEQPLVRVDAGPLGEVLEGAARPGHFDGVLTVVAKLLHLVRPDVAFFGQKDAQQLLLIRRMVADLDFPVEVVAVPTVRDPDGLALSSRNTYLTDADRGVALALSRSLTAGASCAGQGAAGVRAAALAVLNAQPELRVDYLALVDPATLAEVGDGFTGEALLAVAARVGTTRLIDNQPVTIGVR